MFVTGGYDANQDSTHNITELYNLQNDSWFKVADSPYPKGVNHNAVIYHGYNTFYTFGGWTEGEELTIIARLKYYHNEDWEIMGNMKTGRYRHSIIISYANPEHWAEILVVGGCCDSKPTENCSIRSGGIECESQEPMLDGYSYLPVLYNTNTPVPYYCY